VSKIKEKKELTNNLKFCLEYLGDKQSVSKEQRKDDTLGLKWKQEL
jgi:hypothetical protein